MEEYGSEKTRILAYLVQWLTCIFYLVKHFSQKKNSIFQYYMTANSDTQLSLWRAPTLLSLPLERPYGYPIKFSKPSFTVTPVVISKAVLIHNNSISFDKKKKEKDQDWCTIQSLFTNKLLWSVFIFFFTRMHIERKKNNRSRKIKIK